MTIWASESVYGLGFSLRLIRRSAPRSPIQEKGAVSRLPKQARGIPLLTGEGSTLRLRRVAAHGANPSPSHLGPARDGWEKGRGVAVRLTVMLGPVPSIHALNTAIDQRRRGWSLRGRP